MVPCLLQIIKSKRPLGGSWPDTITSDNSIINSSCLQLCTSNVVRLALYLQQSRNSSFEVATCHIFSSTNFMLKHYCL